MTTKTPLKLVHISDTHDKLKYLIEQNKIPDGDILCHTGDFSNKGGKESIEHFNYLLGKLPHKYKIIIFGNHDCYQNFTPQEIQKILTNGIYLQDSSIVIEGLKFYGTPWTNCHWSYCTNDLKSIWDNIPKDTDILMTHMPPFNILDLAWDTSQKSDGLCQYCHQSHRNYRHWGCLDLYKKVVFEIKPKVHLFGHVHDEGMVEFSDHSVGVKKINETYFCNSAMDIEQKALVFTL